MPAADSVRQKTARGVLSRLFLDASNVWVIHYSCESFYDRTDGKSPRITSIATRKLDSAQTVSFSIHQIGEREGFTIDRITDEYDQLERKMLDAYFDHISVHRGMSYLHWNMRDINYGFAAIEHRYHVLGGLPFAVPDDRKFDLSRLLIDIYGVAYIGHPRLQNLIKLNNMTPRDFLNGASEAEAFEKRNYVGLHQSTLRKVDILANIAGRANDRDLKTLTKWWDMYGGRVRGPVRLIAENRIFQVVAGVASIIGLFLAIYLL